nr:MAG TPA: hypothetical protein [Caudoviricetes sp.]DAX07982.1 MAG TPA: hypothetical protein [Bacteriophage sp.]
MVLSSPADFVNCKIYSLLYNITGNISIKHMF